ncbi:hypothetical protein [Amycolatopsis samaneae]|uniref:WXG100 family type VII secretion target n=1 Tax=Amycolatopsis samaneae TaxID=664691 RepID=A0ABW5GRF9_9PSEU
MSSALGRQARRPPEPAPGQPTLDTVLGQVEAADPASFLRQAEAIDRVTEHLRGVIGGYENRTRELETSWAGHSATAHSELAGRVTAEVKRLLRSLAEPGYGNVLRQASIAVTAAQQQLRALRQQRDQALAAEPQPSDPAAATARNAQFDSQAGQILRQLSIVYEDAGRALTALPGCTVFGSPVPDGPSPGSATGGGSGAGGQQPSVYSGGGGHSGDGHPGNGYSGGGDPSGGYPGSGYFIGGTSGRSYSGGGTSGGGYSGGGPASSCPGEQVPGSGGSSVPSVLGGKRVRRETGPVTTGGEAPFSTWQGGDPSPGPEMFSWRSGPVGEAPYSTWQGGDPSPGPEMFSWRSGPVGEAPYSTWQGGDPSPGPEMYSWHSGPGFVTKALGKPEEAPATGGDVRGGGGSGPQGENSPGKSVRHEPVAVTTSSASPPASVPYETVSGGQSGSPATTAGTNVSTSGASSVKFDSTSNSFQSPNSGSSSDVLTSAGQQQSARPQPSANGFPGSQANAAGTDYGAAVSRASGVSGTPASGHMVPMTGGMAGGAMGAQTNPRFPFVPLTADPSAWDPLGGVTAQHGPPGVVGRGDGTPVRKFDAEPGNGEYGEEDDDD